MSNLSATNTNVQTYLKSEKFDLLGHLNAFFKTNRQSLDFSHLEETLSCIDKNRVSMRDYLEALVNSSLWQEWKIESNPYFSMILKVGSEIDRLASIHSEPPYHSKSHMMDVCLMVTCLLMNEFAGVKSFINNHLWATSLSEKWLLLLSAAVHDLGHPGLMNSSPYELELNSLHLLQTLLDREGYDSYQIEEVMKTLSPLVLATEHAQYNNLVNRLTSSDCLHTDCLAMLLVEADLASSVLPNRGRELTKRLSQEWALLHPKQSADLSNLTGYVKFLKSLKFISPHSNLLGIPEVLRTTISELKPQLI